MRRCAAYPLVMAGPDDVRRFFTALAERVEGRLFGVRESLGLVLIGIITDSHVLIDDVPGVGKTTMVRMLASLLGLDFARVQFTPDLMPSDITGTLVLNLKNQEFEFRPGPIFTQVLLADEINRATPKTQAALLEAMQERQVTVDGVSYPLPDPFFVLATQNPVELEGTFPLPEAQLDRFLLRIRMGYPDRGSEIEMLDAHGDHSVIDQLGAVAGPKEVQGMTAVAHAVHVHPTLKGYLVDLADATRNHESLALGISPRATLALQRAARANAASEGRDYVLPDDVKALAGPVLEHRLMLTPEAAIGGVGADEVLDDVLSSVPVPALRR